MSNHTCISKKYWSYLTYMNPNPRMYGLSQCTSNPFTCFLVSFNVYNLYRRQYADETMPKNVRNESGVSMAGISEEKKVSPPPILFKSAIRTMVIIVVIEMRIHMFIQLPQILSMFLKFSNSGVIGNILSQDVSI